MSLSQLIGTRNRIGVLSQSDDDLDRTRSFLGGVRTTLFWTGKAALCGLEAVSQRQYQLMIMIDGCPWNGLSMSRDDSERWDDSAGIGSNPAAVTSFVSSLRCLSILLAWLTLEDVFPYAYMLDRNGNSTLCSTLMGLCIFLKSIILRRLVDVDSVRSIKQATKRGLL